MTSYPDHDFLMWDALLNAESHKERVRFRVECQEARERLERTAREHAARLAARPSDVAWSQTLARFQGDPLPTVPQRVLALDAWVR